MGSVHNERSKFGQRRINVLLCTRDCQIWKLYFPHVPCSTLSRFVSEDRPIPKIIRFISFPSLNMYPDTTFGSRPVSRSSLAGNRAHATRTAQQAVHFGHQETRIGWLGFHPCFVSNFPYIIQYLRDTFRGMDDFGTTKPSLGRSPEK